MKKERGIALTTLIIIIVAILIVGGVAIFFVVKGSDKDKEKTNYSQIKNGNVNLVKTATQKIEPISNNCYKTTDENSNTIIMNNNGKSINIGKATYKYLGDNYIVYGNDGETKIIVYDINEGKEVYSYNDYNIGGISTARTCYKNGVLYYSDDVNNKVVTIAYDLINKKELWRVDGDIYPNRDTCLQEDFIRLNGEIPTIDEDRNILPSVIVNYNGQTIVNGNTEEYKIYTTKTNYYIKYKEKENIEVYNLNNNLVSQLSMKEDEKYSYRLIQVLDNGMYIILCYDKNGTDSRYDLYDINSKAVLNKSEYIKVSSDILSGEVNSTNTMVVNDGMSKRVLINNYKIFDTCSSYYKKVTPIFSEDINDVNHYLILNYVDDNYKTTKRIVNLDTLKIIDNPIQVLEDSFEEAPNGEYIILNSGNDFYVYDSEFNKKYESTNYLRPINDKFVLETTDGGLSIINIETGQKNQLEVQGKYYKHTQNALITFEGNNYYLYAFN